MERLVVRLFVNTVEEIFVYIFSRKVVSSQSKAGDNAQSCKQIKCFRGPSAAYLGTTSLLGPAECVLCLVGTRICC